MTETEEAILLAATEEFLQEGYRGARTVSIAQKAGVTHAMLHYYFRTKEQLFQRVVKDKISQIADSVLIMFEDSRLPLLSRIENGILRHFDLISEHPQLPLFIVSEVSKNDIVKKALNEAVLDKAGTMMTSLQKDIDEAASQGICEKVSAAMLVMDILAVNLFTFIPLSVFNELPGGIASKEDYLAMRRKENVRLIIKRLSI